MRRHSDRADQQDCESQYAHKNFPLDWFTARTSSRHMPGSGDIGTAVIADRAQHSRHQFVERGLVRQVLDIEDRAVVEAPNTSIIAALAN